MKFLGKQKKPQGKAENTKPYIETQQENLNMFQPVNPAVIQCSTLLRRTCRDLSIGRFIQAYCNGDYTGVIKKGKPTEQQILDAWNEILFEYSGLIKGENTGLLMQLHKQIIQLSWLITYCNYAVTVLKIRYVPEIIETLREEGFTIEDPFESDQYFESLEGVKSLCASKSFDYDDLKKEYDRLSATQQGKKQTEEDFELTLVGLSRFQHYHIDADTTSVFRFTQIYNSYIGEVNVIAKKRLTDG